VSLPGAPKWIEICAPGALSDGVDSQAALAGPVTVVLRPGARLSGQVLDADGEPVDGLSVHAQIAGPTPDDCTPTASPCSDYQCAIATSTDGEGRFALTPLKPGWYTLGTGYGPLEIKSAPLDLASGQLVGGRFLFSRLPAGTYTLRALRSNRKLIHQQTVQIPAPEGSELVVDLGSL
jgi:hypothetical protein